MGKHFSAGFSDGGSTFDKNGPTVFMTFSIKAVNILDFLWVLKPFLMKSSPT